MIFNEMKKQETHISDDYNEIPIRDFFCNNLKLPGILYMCSMLIGEKMDISEEGYKKNEFSSGWKRVNRDTSKDTIGINLKSLDENIEKFKDEISELFKEKDLKEELLKEKISLLENNISSIANEVSLLHREIAEQNEIIKKAISILYKLQENKEVAEDTANRGGFKNNLFRKR